MNKKVQLIAKVSNETKDKAKLSATIKKMSVSEYVEQLIINDTEDIVIIRGGHNNDSN